MLVGLSDYFTRVLDRLVTTMFTRMLLGLYKDLATILLPCFYDFTSLVLGISDSRGLEGREHPLPGLK